MTTRKVKSKTQFIKWLQTAENEQLTFKPKMFKHDYTPAEAVDVIAKYHESNSINNHKELLWEMLYRSIINASANGLDETFIETMANEFQSVCSLISATKSLYI